MDNLLDKLRAGEIDTNKKRNRNAKSMISREKRMQKSESVAILAEDLLRSIQSESDDRSTRRRTRLARRQKASPLGLIEEYA
jgi:cytokinesis protein